MPLPRNKSFLCSLLFASLLCHSLSATPTRFEVKDVGFRNLVYFVSEAPLETVVGQTNFVTGWLELDPGNLKEGIKGTFEVDVRTFETGMPARNAKVRDLFLGATKQPIAVFTFNRFAQVSAPVLKPGMTVTGKVEGTLSANQVETRLILPVRLTFWKDGPMVKKKGLTGNLIQVRSEFPLRLGDFKVGVPTQFQGLIDPEAKFSAHFFGADRLPASTTP